MAWLIRSSNSGEGQGPVVEGAGQPEAVAHQTLLPGPVAVVHGPDLGQGHVALVHKQQEVLGEVVQQRHGRGAHRAARDDPGIVLDAGAVAQLLHHLDVVEGPLADALGLQQLVVLLEYLTWSQSSASISVMARAILSRGVI